jgi:hypothetical protein
LPGAAVAQRIENARFGVPHQGFGAIVDVGPQLVQGGVHGLGPGGLKTIQRLGRTLEVLWLAAIDLPAAAQAFIHQARAQTVGQEGLCRANPGGASADDDGGRSVRGWRVHKRRPGSRFTHTLASSSVEQARTRRPSPSFTQQS